MRAGRDAEHWRRSLARALAFGLLAALLAVPWWIKNVVYTGNPVYPLASSIFAGGEWSELNAAIYSEHLAAKGQGRNWRAFMRLPWSTAAYPVDFGGFEVGPFYWVFFPWIAGWCAFSLIRVRSSPVRAMAALWLAFILLFWFFTYQSNRFLLPGWALATAVAVAAFYPLLEQVRKLRILAALGILLPLTYNYADCARKLILSNGRWPAYTMGYLSRDDYLAANLNYYRFARQASEDLGPDQKILLVGEHRKMHWLCRVEGSEWYDSPRILPFLRQANNAVEFFRHLRAAGFTHIFFNFDEWKAGWSDNRRHFTSRDLALLKSILDPDFLGVEERTESGGLILYRILPEQPK